ncbi:zinc ABC transporter substrate-binding protein [Wenxinia saemankumensis]|uniref:High-affinity zinc uptake system protein ZnuA n=1 Tax=Wenxinia saemankumensis TaxID=1447782 RepID=A0A1M6HXJ4_9RHOB|nr:zinc ABC transporter substrate-binding protein [Wenxinia saemankumensis]SHJ26905.1 zinc transport system substrate-binding protein [Wenxinia saemankumensis]
MSTSLGRGLACSALAIAAASTAPAEVPRVATDIAPVHGLAARVMDGLGTPDLVVTPGASPHEYAMRPSEARALQEADAVFWIGAELEPWLEESIGALATDARVVELLDVEGITTLEFREGATFEGHDHEHGDDAGHDHDHDAGDHPGHEDEAEGDHAHAEDDHADGDHGSDHAEGAAHVESQGDGAHADHAVDEDHDHAGHSHEGIDPHAWLDPGNAGIWLDVIAEELSALDPENAQTYRDNAAAGREEIAAAVADVEETLSAAGGVGFVVFHDAYHYFENRFGISAAGAISLSDASDPSPARIEEVQETIRDLGVACIYSEPQFSQSLVATVSDGTEARAAVIDPLGFELETGPGFYPALIRSIGESIAGCASS